MQCVLHVQQSTDGSSTRWFVMSQGFCQSGGMINKAADVPAVWTEPAINTFGSTNGNSNWPTIGYNENAWTGARVTGTNIGMYISGEGIISGLIGEYFTTPNDLDSSYPIIPMGLVCTAYPYRGRHGRIVDLWWGQTSAPPSMAGTT